MTTHYAHVRYAAKDDPGVIYYDPRDNREKFTRDVEDADLSHGERTVTSVKIKPWRRAQFGEPAEAYFVEINTAELERRCGGDYRKGYRKTERFESVEEAREYAKENVPGYADAERKNALEARGVMEEVN